MDEAVVKQKISLGTILFTVFLDLLGIGIIIPIIPALIVSGNLFPPDYADSSKNLILGFLIAVYPFAQFFGAPVLGALSDKIGRKKVLIYSVTGSVIGYLLFAYGVLTNNLQLLFLGRIIDGITGGNIAVIYSSLADISDEKTKAKNFGLVGMMFGLGFIMGPFLGGELANPELVSWFNYSTPFFFAAILSFFNLIMIIARFKETLHTKKDSVINVFTGIKNITKAFGIKELRTIFLIAFLVTFSFTMFSQFFQVFLIKKFSFNQSNIGRLLAFYGFCSVIVQGGIVRQLAKRVKPEQVLAFSLLFLAISFYLQLLPNTPTLIYVTMGLVAVAQGLTNPNVTAMVSNLADESIQGEILGINQSVQALAQAIPPIIGGITISMNINTPITISSFTALLGWLLFLATFSFSKKTT